jgi:hypothetical protein
MDSGVWTFARGADTLQIRRHDQDDGIALAIAGDGVPRSYFFRDPDRLEVFQKDMETLLLKTGWSFVSFEPDRRAGQDRRDWPRRSNDRRRWWTDGARKTTDGTADGESAKTDRERTRPRSSEK